MKFTKTYTDHGLLNTGSSYRLLNTTTVFRSPCTDLHRQIYTDIYVKHLKHKAKAKNQKKKQSDSIFRH